MKLCSINMILTIHNPQLALVQQLSPLVRLSYANASVGTRNRCAIPYVATYRLPPAILQSCVPDKQIPINNLRHLEAQDTFTAENFVPFTVVMLIGTLCAALKKY